MSSLPSKITKPSNAPTVTLDKLLFSGSALGSKKNKQKKRKKSKTGVVIGSKKTQENTLGNAHKVVIGVGVENVDGNGGEDDGRNCVGVNVNVGHEPDIGDSVEPGVDVGVDNNVGGGGETKVDVKAGVGVDTGVGMGVGVKVSNPYRHDTNNVNASA